MASLNLKSVFTRFKYWLLLCLVVLAFSPFVASAQDSKLAGELSWKNGDKLPGQIVSSDHSHLKWQSKLFRDALEIDLRFLDQVNLDSNTLFEKTAETYAIQTVDGFSLYGEVKKLSDKELIVTSERFGEFSVDRSKVATILNLKTSGSLINGEFDLSQWSANRDEKKYWKVNEQGELQSLRSNVHLFLKSELPESALIEVEMEWDKKLDFTFGFGVPKSSRKIELLPRLESWDDAIVLSYNDDFEIVLESNESESKRIKFLIHWNRVSNQLVIHDERGKILATANLGKQPTSIEPGIYLENKSGDLRVTSLMIRRSAKGFDATAPSIQTLDDAAINGQVESFDGTNWVVREAPSSKKSDTDGEDDSQGEDSTVKIANANFCGAFLINPPVERPTGQSRVKYHDGMFVRGELISIGGNKATLSTNLSSDPIELDLTGARSVQFEAPDSESASDFSHRLYNKVGQIQGKLEPGSGSADDIMRWRVAGAKSAVPFSQGDGRIVLQDNTPIEKIKNKWADTLYLANRDTVPCRVVRMDENQVIVDSFFENNAIDQALIKAVDFSSQAVAEFVDADDEDWKIPDASAKRVKQEDNKILLSSKAEIGHPWLFAGGGFQFELAWKNNLYGALECQTLVGDLNSADGGKKINITMYGENIFVGNLGESNPTAGMVSVKNGRAKISLKYQKGKLEVTVNGKKAYSETVASSSNRGRGIKFKLVDLFQQGTKCEISKFRLLVGNTGNSAMVDAEQKKLLLTIPRLKKLRPPKHILCANNLDMLRGELISLNHEHVIFKTNNEVKRFPREVVSSVVWLHAEGLAKSDLAAPDVVKEKPVEESALEEDLSSVSVQAPTSEQTVQVLMRGNRRMTTTLQSWADEKLSGDSEALGPCDIPFDQIYELRFGSFATKATDIAYSDWVAELAPSPKMETGADGQPGSGYAFGSASPLIGTTPKSFTLATIEGKKFSLKDEIGKVVVLDFWATWCGPCVQALPKLRDTVAQYSSDEVVLLAINQEEAKDQVRSFLEARSLDIPVGLDSGKIGRQFNVESLPQTVIINPDGVIAYVKVGNSNDLEEKLKAAVDKLLKEDREAVK